MVYRGQSVVNLKNYPYDSVCYRLKADSQPVYFLV